MQLEQEPNRLFFLFLSLMRTFGLTIFSMALLSASVGGWNTTASWDWRVGTAGRMVMGGIYPHSPLPLLHSSSSSFTTAFGFILQPFLLIPQNSYIRYCSSINHICEPYLRREESEGK
ncbi:hypothetical protein L873DRAFT_1846062 [Choiromyces venosus 120613-1]|uniref:Uncharacterized protein n=1 Tax=Choiromyces venosus 120613-1 TaxID=1336337 RepID=A0A3N4JDL4_9PEZI|nr:hypothetical protein L873DRAFT_1846062 [Choiromyces venosus 120613-1]